MPFIPDARIFATNEMNRINPGLTVRFENLILCMSIHTDLAPTPKSKKILAGSQEHITKLAESFSLSRLKKAPKEPSTIPDKMVSEILNIYFGIPRQQLEGAKRLHSLSMAAENIVGDLLERYIASIVEPEGWIWCSGSTIKAVDFIKPPVNHGDKWSLLQVKNRDNSENSSSRKVRDNTPIIKWHRTYSKTGATNWAAFPCEITRKTLSEEGFVDFVRQYLSNMPE